MVAEKLSTSCWPNRSCPSAMCNRMVFIRFCAYAQMWNKMSYSGRQPKTATHEECAHFKDGLCTLIGAPVNPHQPACPNFTPIDKKMTSQSIKTHPQPRQRTRNYVHPAYSPPFRQSIYPPPRYTQNQPWTAPHNIRSYRANRQRHVIPKQSTAVTYSISSRRGGGGGSGRGRRGGNSNRGRGRGKGRGAGFAGPGGSCICPNCDYTVPHRPGTPCFQQKCPKCGTSMVRKSWKT